VRENEIVLDLLRQAEALATDRDRGASELARELLTVLDLALARAPDLVVPIARCVCTAQAAMAPLWHLSAAAVAERDRPGSFVKARLAFERAPAALARTGAAALLEEWGSTERPLVLTMSFSGSVRDVLGAAHAQRALRVVCGEGRPRFEGRRLAEALAAAGLDVTLVTDAGLSAWLDSAAAVLVGADGVASRFWINKVGTRVLAAAARTANVPVWVACTADKALPALLAEGWASTSADPAEVWAEAPVSVRVYNRYFEAIPADLASGFLTDVGLLIPDDLPAFCERGAAEVGALQSALVQQP
jgi:hypothetical protein